MVETALVLPLMLLVILGVVEFGRAFMVSQLLVNAAREGNRLAVMSGVTTAQVDAEVRTVVQNTVGVDPAQVAVTITVTPFAGGGSHSDLSIAQKRDLCEVSAAIPYDQVSYVPVRWMTGVNLSGQCAMRHE